MKLAVLSMVFFLFLSACVPFNSYCPNKETKIALEELTNINERWADAFEIAEATPRVNLASVIVNLQEIKRDANTLDVPECLKDALHYLVNSMEYSIDGFISFMAEDPESIIEGDFNLASVYLRDAKRNIQIINNCLPYCRPTAIPSPTVTLIPTLSPSPTLSPTPTMTNLPVLYIVEAGECPNGILNIEGGPKKEWCTATWTENHRGNPNENINQHIEAGFDTGIDSDVIVYCAIFSPDGRLIDFQIDTDNDGKVICEPYKK